ncbi:MAG: type II secretion system F family protein [Armatimonadota bacterium]|nr:type II secretion system F family protein [Armatimonadota bacterium]
MLLALVVILFFCSVLSVTIGIRMEIDYRTPLARLWRGTRAVLTGEDEEEGELRRPLLVRLIGPAAQRLLEVVAKVSPSALKDSIRRRLIASGNPWRASSEEVVLAKVILGCTGLFLGVWTAVRLLNLGARQSLLAGIVAMGLGFFGPDVMIFSRTRRRRKQIQRSMPYVLDLLSVCVGAGLSFDAAMQKVAEKVRGPLTDEFRQVSYEVRIGKPRRDALRDMRDRCGVEDLNVFVASLIQADRLGLSIGQVLRVQADLMRNLRRERAREAAMKIPIKMLFPLIFLILPAMFVVILGPAVLQMMQALSGTAGF